MADSEYVFSEGDLSFVPSGFLAQILMVSGLSSPPSPTEATIAFNYELLQTTPHSGFPEWALAIIIPCIIAIVLIPCWIILCVSATKKIAFSTFPMSLQNILQLKM